MLSALIFPEEVSTHGGYEDYLIERRYWFFGLIAVITLLDLIDTSLKGAERWQTLGIAYPIKTAVMLVIAGLGMILTNKKAHLALALIALVYLHGALHDPVFQRYRLSVSLPLISRAP